MAKKKLQYNYQKEIGESIRDDEHSKGEVIVQKEGSNI